MQGPSGPQSRTRGRPRLPEKGSTLTVYLPVGAHDRIIKMAKAQDKSISATIRQLLILRLP